VTVRVIPMDASHFAVFCTNKALCLQGSNFGEISCAVMSGY
jgi:hypothetical protein